MIIYFADRMIDILGSASTNHNSRFVIVDDNKTEDSEVRSIGHIDGKDIDFFIRQETDNFGYGAGFVFNQYGNLFDNHNDLLIFPVRFFYQ